MGNRSDAMAEFAVRVSAGKLELQRCEECGAVAWPPREACAACWSDRLVWTEIVAKGDVIATTKLHTSQDEFFRARLPWRVALIRLDAGPVAYAHLAPDSPEEGAVRIHGAIDQLGRAVFVATMDRDGAASEFAGLWKISERRNP
jgi:uncharacterized OB-fold protein